jgi:hypothetical protein
VFFLVAVCTKTDCICLSWSGLANKCLIQNGGCEDECRLDGAGEVECHCFSGRTLMEDGQRCASKDESCNAESFHCSSGGCIPYHLTCDTVSACEDNSDEDPIFCGMFVLLSLLAGIISEMFILRQTLSGLGLEVFTAVSMKYAIFWDVVPCDFIINQCF